MGMTASELVARVEQDEMEIQRQMEAATNDGNAMSSQQPNAAEAPASPAPSQAAQTQARTEPAQQAAPDSVPISEYRALAEQVRALKDTFNGTKGQMAQQMKEIAHENELLKLRLEQAARQPARQDAPVQSDDLAELTDLFGEGPAKAMAKFVAKKDSKIEALEAKLAQMNDSVKQEIGQRAEQQQRQLEERAFRAKVVEAMPGIEKIAETDGDFDNWMRRTANGYGMLMLNAFNAAYQARSIDGMRMVVNDYLAFCKRTGAMPPPGFSFESSGAVNAAPANSGAGLAAKALPVRSGASEVSTSAPAPLTMESVDKAVDLLNMATLNPSLYARNVLDEAQAIVDRAFREGYKT